MFTVNDTDLESAARRFEKLSIVDLAPGMYRVCKIVNYYDGVHTIKSHRDENGMSITLLAAGPNGETNIKYLYRGWASILTSSMTASKSKRAMYEHTKLEVRQMKHPFKENRDIPCWVWVISTVFNERLTSDVAWRALEGVADVLRPKFAPPAKAI